jgi:hypothetical protein
LREHDVDDELPKHHYAASSQTAIAGMISRLLLGRGRLATDPCTATRGVGGRQASQPANGAPPRAHRKETPA